MHKKHPAGSQTKAQLAAERTNLMAARAALEPKVSAGILKAEAAWIAAGEAAWVANEWGKGGGGGGHSKGTEKGKAAARKALNYKDLRGGTRHPLGTRILTVTLLVRPSDRKPTGIVHKFKQRIAPTGYDTRTAWKQSRRHKYKHRLHVRKVKKATVKKWRHRKHNLHPR